MANKCYAQAFAALLAAAAIAPGPVAARDSTARHHAYGSMHRLGHYDLKTQFRPGAYGLSAVSSTRALPGGRRFETDPDPHVRFEMKRDDHDRRASGS
jgi:hypothetical protein